MLLERFCGQRGNPELAERSQLRRVEPQEHPSIVVDQLESLVGQLEHQRCQHHQVHAVRMCLNDFIELFGLLGTVPRAMRRRRLEQAPFAQLDHERVEGTRFGACTRHSIRYHLVDRAFFRLGEGLEQEQLTDAERKRFSLVVADERKCRLSEYNRERVRDSLAVPRANACPQACRLLRSVLSRTTATIGADGPGGHRSAARRGVVNGMGQRHRARNTVAWSTMVTCGAGRHAEHGRADRQSSTSEERPLGERQGPGRMFDRPRILVVADLDGTPTEHLAL
jgi:hypothetical protein